MRSLLLILLLSGCVTAPQRSGVYVDWVEVDDVNKFCQAKRKVVSAKGRMYGCAEYERGVWCTIWTDKLARPELERVVFYSAGHELYHCFKGHFHGDPT